MADELMQPAPEPFDPQSKEEVEQRFGEKIAVQWVNAQARQRAAMIKQLLSLEAHVKKHEVEEATNNVIEIDEEVDDARRAMLREKTYLFTGDAKQEQLLKANRNLYLGEVTQKLSLLQGQNVPHASRLREDVSTRCLQIHVIDTLLGGRLTFDAVKSLVAADTRCTDLSDAGKEYEYEAFLERLILKQFVRVEPPASGS